MNSQNIVEDNWSKAAANYSNNIQKELNSFKRNAWIEIIWWRITWQEKNI